MPLPKLKTPEFPVTFPLSGLQKSFRPYTVGDEKLLLAAAAARSDNPKFYIDNTLKVIKDCVSDDGFVDTLAAVDVEYLLLQIRAKSVGEKVPIKYTDKKTKKMHQVEIDLEQFSVTKDPEHLYKIELTEGMGVQMRDLLFSQKIEYASKFTEQNKSGVIYETIIDCVKSIYDKDNIWVVGTDCTREEVREFVEGLVGVSDKFYKFIATMPQLAITFKLPNGTEHTLTGNEIDFLALSQDTLTS